MWEKGDEEELVKENRQMHPGVCSSPTARAGKVLWNESSQDSHAGDTEQEENGEMGLLATCKEAA